MSEYTLQQALRDLEPRPDGYDAFGFHHEHGFKTSVTQEAKHARIRALMAKQVADVNWMERPFVPRDLDKFRSTRITINLGDLLRE